MASALTLDTVRHALRSPAALDPAPQGRFALRGAGGKTAFPETGPPPGIAARPAAVLILVHAGDGEPRVVLTRRTEHLPVHAGQIAFPGGARDPADADLLATALRETTEELGIQARALEVVGELAPVYVPPSNYLVSPYVAVAEQRPQYRADPAEVAEVLEVELGFFLDPRSVEWERWRLRGREVQVPLFRHGRHRIWGATARMLAMLVELVAGDRSAT